MRDLAFKKNQRQSLKKSLEIKHALEKNAELAANKIHDYNHKQAVIKQHKQEIELINEEKQQQKNNAIRRREEKIANTLKENVNLENKKKSKILTKINHNDKKVKFVKEIQEQKAMQDSEQHTMVMFERSQRVQRLSHILEYQKKETLEKIMEKMNRIEDFKNQKSVIANQKRQMQEDISRKKAQYAEKFEKIFKNKGIEVRVYSNL